MATLQIFLFGNFRIRRADWHEEIQLTRVVQAFFGYLLINRQRVHPREVLADLFWGDRAEEQARNCLNTTIWRLRKILESEPTEKDTYLKRTTLGEVGFNPECDHWLDVSFFEKQINALLKKAPEILDSNEAGRLERALDLYAGDLLEGLYDEWALRERERMRSLYLKALERLMRYHGHTGNHDKAISCGRKILCLDPLREEIHRAVIRFYRRGGHRNRAIRQYKNCCEILKQELGVPPMEETRALYKEIATVRRLPSSDANPGQAQKLPTIEKTSDYEQVLDKLKLVTDDFERMYKKIIDIAQHLERAIKA